MYHKLGNSLDNNSCHVKVINFHVSLLKLSHVCHVISMYVMSDTCMISMAHTCHVTSMHVCHMTYHRQKLNIFSFIFIISMHRVGSYIGN